MRTYSLRTGAALSAVLALAAAAPTGAAASDTSATLAYLRADDALVRYAAARLSIGEAALQGVLAGVRRECPAAAGAASPQDAESTQLSNEVIGAMVTSAMRPARPAVRRFLAAVAGLHFGDRALAGAVRSYTARLRTLIGLAQPHLCADVRAWAASGYRALAPATVAFDAAFMPSWVALGELPGRLTRYEGGEARLLAQRAGRAESQISEFEANAVPTWGAVMNALVLSP